MTADPWERAAPDFDAPRGNWCEANDDYAGEIFRRGRHRVIMDRLGKQWIVQRQGSSKAGQRRWRSLHYATTRMALVRLWQGVEPEFATIPALDKLPTRIGARMGAAA